MAPGPPDPPEQAPARAPAADLAIALVVERLIDDAGLAPTRRGVQLEAWVALGYAVLAGAWITLSDLLVALSDPGARGYLWWSIGKGLGFVAVTALGLYLGVRWALARERRSHRRVAASEALLRGITDALPDPVFVKDRQCNWLFANPATLVVQGREAHQVLGHNDAQIYTDPAVGEALMANDRRVMESGRPAVLEEWVQTPTGLRLFLSTKSPLRAADGAVIGLVGVARDITERKRAEDERQLAEAGLRQAQKLESVGRLAGGVAHDFNNLLTVILGYTQELLTTVDGDGRPRREDVAEIQGAAERASELTRQLLAFARKQVIAPVALDLNRLVRGTEKLLRRVLGEDIEVVAALDDRLWRVRCDPGQLEQVILNLAVNARDAMPDGGALRLETSNLMVGDEAVRPDAELRPGRWVRLTVRDSGVGISEEVKAHLFEPFFTTKGPGQGTGLGLATVHGIIGQAGGHIHAESAPGQGTAFVICLPATDEQPPSLAGREGPAPRGSGTILLVEDDWQVRKVTVRALEGAGYRVLAAGGGDEALAVARAHPGPIDLVITDVVMPGLDGSKVAAALAQARPGVRVLYVSGYTRDAIASHGVLDEGVHFLPKPFTRKALLEQVARVLAE